MTRSIRLTVRDTDMSVRLNITAGQNAETSDFVWNLLPLETIIGHVVVSGGGLWVPTRGTYLGPRASVPRRQGSVYFYPPMQSIAITYGAVSESAFVNEFARVPDEDLETLTKIGKHVWDQTIVDPHRHIQRVILTQSEGSTES